MVASEMGLHSPSPSYARWAPVTIRLMQPLVLRALLRRWLPRAPHHLDGALDDLRRSLTL